MSMNLSRRWFHFNVDGAQAERLLLAQTVADGTFLVRPSRTSSTDYVLSVKRENKVFHFRIRKNNNDCYDLNSDENFASIVEGVMYYYERQKVCEKNGEVIELKHFYFADDPTPERWFHTGISGQTAEQLLKEQGRNGSFLVRESQSVAGNYAISLRADDESGAQVTHVIINCRNGLYDVGGGDQFRSMTDLVDHYRRNPMVQTSGAVMHLKHPFNATRVWASDIRKRIEFLDKIDPVKKRSGFRDEFEAVQQNECKYLYDRKEGQRLENRAKNRFKNILPYDHTRVVLKTAHNAPPHSDYINANFITINNDYDEFCGVQRSYISCQGCLSTTVDDFWRMVWQEQCPCIIMITKEVELGKPKCARYWPDVQKTKRHGFSGELFVTNRDEQAKADFTVRNLVVRCDGSPLELRVQHLQFTTWPDHGVPADASSVLSLIDQLDDCLRDSGTASRPLCVHCSAGIGRSGTFVAIDLVLTTLKRNGIGESAIDISRTVQMIRSQRSGMVQTEAQYRFVYTAVEQYVETRKLAEQKRSEPNGREYTNIRYPVESQQQRTPTTPMSTGSLGWSPPAEPDPSVKPIKLDPPPLSKRIVTSK